MAYILLYDYNIICKLKVQNSDSAEYSAGLTAVQKNSH